ncbi:hypothetical protein UJ101_02042 [Flavobacteriaceae bacterium UJ101]|nr:hypothetical protein UJ101_02042 [Flavobacteriaceae bacterium UJ101]
MKKETFILPLISITSIVLLLNLELTPLFNWSINGKTFISLGIMILLFISIKKTQKLNKNLFFITITTVVICLLQIDYDTIISSFNEGYNYALNN